MPEKPVPPPGLPPERLTYDIGAMNVSYGSFWEVDFICIYKKLIFIPGAFTVTKRDEFYH